MTSRDSSVPRPAPPMYFVLVNMPNGRRVLDTFRGALEATCAANELISQGVDATITEVARTVPKKGRGHP